MRRRAAALVAFALAALLAPVAAVAPARADDSPPPAPESVASASCIAPGTLECPVYERYVNHKYGFSVDVPAVFVKKAPDADGRGQPFELGSKVRIRAWAMFDNPPMTLQQLYADWTRRDGVTYKGLAKNTWAVRGRDRTRLFYTRSILADGIICTIEVSYEPEVAAVIEPVLARMGATLQPLPGEGIRGKTH
jgi:hypothetical protein